MHENSPDVALGIDIGGTKVRLGIVQSDSRILDTISHSVIRSTMAEFYAGLIKYMDEFLTGKSNADHIKGIGIGTHGLIDNKTGRYRSDDPFSEAEEFDLCTRLEERYGLPVKIENDLKATALAELRWGAGRRINNFAYVNVGTGLAVGLIENRRLLRGQNNFSGEVGLWLLPPTEKRPYIHNLESVVSGGGLNLEIRRRGGLYPDSLLFERIKNTEPVRSFEIFDACKAGDSLALDVLDSFEEMLSYMIMNLESTLNLSAYIFGGGVFTYGDWLLGRLMKKINCINPNRSENFTFNLQLSELGSGNAGLLGAANTIFDNF